MEDYLSHHGILGQKWGVRNYQNKDGSLTAAGRSRYQSTSVRSAIARRQNKKVDEGFKRWKEGSQNKSNAIESGKRANEARLAYEKSNRDRDLRKEYRTANSQYKKDLRSNTHYRQGSVREEVGRDLSRKYLTEAKRVEKQLKMDPNNKALQKQYNNLMSQHDIERARARRAQEVGARRSQQVSNLKRSATKTVKGLATTAAVGIGLYEVNKFLKEHNVTLNGQPFYATPENYAQVADLIKKGKNILGFLYV